MVGSFCEFSEFDWKMEAFWFALRHRGVSDKEIRRFDFTISQIKTTLDKEQFAEFEQFVRNMIDIDWLSLQDEQVRDKLIFFEKSCLDKYPCKGIEEYYQMIFCH